MAMDAVDVPSKWVCRLTSFLGDGSSKSGTGFVVNIPGSKRLSIMTAGHNIVDVGSGRASNIEVVLPNGLTFRATPDEYFASRAYEANPTDRSQDETSIFDFGLISVDKKKYILDPKQDPGGCAFSILTTDYEMLHMEVSVHGYKYGEMQQTHNTSPLSRVDSNALYYSKETVPGVSGGPVFVSKDGVYTAVGIHNHDSRAIRLTCRMLLEMLSWIQDYKLRRRFEILQKNAKDGQRPGVCLQSSSGSRPRIIARQAQNPSSHMRFVLSDVPKAEKGEQRPHYVVLPAQDQEDEGKPLRLLTLVQSNEEASIEFRETAVAQRCHEIDIGIQGSGKILWFPRSKLSLTVQPSNRGNHCDYGCITQDQAVKASTKATAFIVSELQPSAEARDVPRPSNQSNLPSLYRAVINQDVETVQKHLEQNSDPNAACRCGTSALAKAAENGDIKIVDLLLKRGARIDTRNLDSESPEDLAQRNGHVNVISKFKTWRAQRVRVLTQEAAKDSSISMPKIQDLLNSGVPAAARNDMGGRSALDLAAQNGRRDTVLVLLRDWAVNPNDVDNGRQTALHWAAKQGHGDVVTLLREYGADPNMHDESRWTPLHRAAEGGHEDAANALCANTIAQAKGNVNKRPEAEAKAKADPNAAGPNGVTPLMQAAWRGRAGMVKLLIGLGADPTLEDRKGKRAKDYAERGGHDDIWRGLP